MREGGNEAVAGANPGGMAGWEGGCSLSPITLPQLRQNDLQSPSSR